MQTDTTDALLEDPGDLVHESIGMMEQAAQIAETVKMVGGRETLRVAAIMATLADHAMALEEEGTVAREAQVLGIRALVDADLASEADRAADLARTITPNDGDAVTVVSAAILTALRAVDGDEVALELVDAKAPVMHRAVCMVDGCPAGVTYQLTASGSSFLVLDRVGMDFDASLGIGADGRPVCPIDGHGQMTLADELLPAAEAFAQVAEKLDGPVQRALPGVFPAFNYAGAFNEIVEQAKRVERLNQEYDDAKKEASEAKKNLDKGAELLMRMTLQFEQRRREKPEPDAPSLAAPRVLKCVWDQQHPDDACPFCNDSQLGPADRAVVEGVLGAELAPPHANAHADQVVTYRTKLDVQATLDALDGVIVDVHPATVAEWTTEQRAEVRAWASDHDAPFDAMPAILGRPHIAAKAGDDANVQACTQCGAVLRTWNEGDGSIVWLSAGARVKTDCPGTQEEGHRYPERTPKAKRKRQADAEPKAEKKATKKARKK
jgi:hypothetical protein